MSSYWNCILKELPHCRLRSQNSGQVPERNTSSFVSRLEFLFLDFICETNHWWVNTLPHWRICREDNLTTCEMWKWWDLTLVFKVKETAKGFGSGQVWGQPGKPPRSPQALDSPSLLFWSSGANQQACALQWNVTGKDDRTTEACREYLQSFVLTTPEVPSLGKKTNIFNQQSSGLSTIRTCKKWNYTHGNFLAKFYGNTLARGKSSTLKFFSYSLRMLGDSKFIKYYYWVKKQAYG